MTFESISCSKIVKTNFLVVDHPLAYNVIIGWPTLNCIQPIVLIYYIMLKFLTSSGVDDIISDPNESIRCHLTSIILPKKVVLLVQQMDPWEPSLISLHPEDGEPLDEISLNLERPNYIVKVRLALTRERNKELINFLRLNLEVFTRSPSNIPRIDHSVVQRRFNINPKHKTFH